MQSNGIVLDERPQVSSVIPTRLYDRSRYGNHGTWTNVTPVRLPSGLWVDSYAGAGSTTLNNSASLNPLAGFTVMFWAIQPIPTSLKQMAAHGIVFSLFTGVNASNYTLYFSDATDTGTVSFGSCTLNRYNHFAMTVTAACTIFGFINGGITVNGTWAKTIRAGTSSLGFGMMPGYGIDWFTGMIGLRKMCNYVLTPAAIRKIYQSERGWFGV